MTDPLTHPGQLCAAGDRAVDLALELGQARVRLARYEAIEARIRALSAAWKQDGSHHGLCTYARAVLAALDEPEAPT